MGRTYHVAMTGSDASDGSIDHPFRTISKAAEIAVSGDTVIVHEGTYREWVRPKNSGNSMIDRIVYKAAENEKVHIKGSEVIKNWEVYEGTVWKTVIPNTFFQGYNPYKQTIFGDWLFYPKNGVMHTGDVYLNGKSFYEARSLDEVKQAPVRESIVIPFFGPKPIPLAHPEDTVYLWYAQVDEHNTTIYANLHSYNPNEELTEINVRKYCFFPDKTGINYITVQGFELSQAATTWAPPTTHQAGLLGANWSKGWIIENNIIHDSKCSGISLGKEGSTGDNDCSRFQHHPGYQEQLEAVFKGLRIGWSKEKIGSHIVRNNTIYDCGQNGIVGNMGCIFSQISHNHIYNIGIKREFFGWEIAAIKFHAPIDVQISNNCIHDSTLGLWLDWQAQGTKISKNVFYANGCDCNIEVSHGPYLFDNNVFASKCNISNMSQGGAFVHNLFCGSMRRVEVLDRSTPYHLPHSTQVKGTSLIYSGDDRFYNNIFIGDDDVLPNNSYYGTHGYDGCPDCYEKYLQLIIAGGDDDLDKYKGVKQPAYINGNVYYRNSDHFDKEKDYYMQKEYDPKVKITANDSGVYLEITLDPNFFSVQTQIQTTYTLGTVRIVNAVYDANDGGILRIDTDINSQLRQKQPTPGPIETLVSGYNKIKIWE